MCMDSPGGYEAAAGLSAARALLRRFNAKTKAICRGRDLPTIGADWLRRRRRGLRCPISVLVQAEPPP